MENIIGSTACSLSRIDLDVAPYDSSQCGTQLMAFQPNKFDSIPYENCSVHDMQHATYNLQNATVSWNHANELQHEPMWLQDSLDTWWFVPGSAPSSYCTWANNMPQSFTITKCQFVASLWPLMYWKPPLTISNVRIVFSVAHLPWTKSKCGP